MRVYFGYQMREGELVLHPNEALQVQSLYQTYLTGLSLAKTGEVVGVDKSHSQIGRILSNANYLGTEIYPKIISQHLFDQVQEERERRKHQLGRNFEAKEGTLDISSDFAWGKRGRVPVYPYQRASYLYKKIEVLA